MGQAHGARGQRQWLANIGKTENGVVGVTSLLADERIYYPVDLEPYTPAHHFEGGKNDPHFRTKLKIASELVELAIGRSIPFRAVVADSFYGEDWGLKGALEELGAGYVLALKPSHAWWHKAGEIGSPWAAAVVAGQGWEDERHPGEWVKVMRRLGDGHEEVWWALEVNVGPYGPRRDRRSVVASTDPNELPDKATWYLTTNLPHPDSERSSSREGGALAPADLSEVVRLYGLRMWVEQSYKQVRHMLGWSDYQVRSDIAIRRHWELVCSAHFRCAGGHMVARRPTARSRPKERRAIYPPSQKERVQSRPQVCWPQALRAVRAWLEPWVMLMRYWKAFSDLPPPTQLKALLERVFSGRGLYLYVH